MELLAGNQHQYQYYTKSTEKELKSQKFNFREFSISIHLNCVLPEVLSKTHTMRLLCLDSWQMQC